ncbi:deaminase domain-containing protein [Paenibacillus dauci]|uniref:deaminase domain-containing protein n=1 Tax=Paenibacillus dauci TaxID=1567106 RepID=UPI0038B3DFB3
MPDISPQPTKDYKTNEDRNPIFPPVHAPNNAGYLTLRTPDTEYKILNDLAENLDEAMKKNGVENRNDLKGEITLFTEKDTCGGCNYTISLFKKRYPGIVIEVIHNKGIQIPTLKND